MPRSRKPVKLTPAHRSRDGVSKSSTSQPKTRLPTIPFCDLVKSSFRNWQRRKNQELFDSAKADKILMEQKNPQTVFPQLSSSTQSLIPPLARLTANFLPAAQDFHT